MTAYTSVGESQKIKGQREQSCATNNFLFGESADKEAYVINQVLAKEPTQDHK